MLALRRHLFHILFSVHIVHALIQLPIIQGNRGQRFLAASAAAIMNVFPLKCQGSLSRTLLKMISSSTLPKEDRAKASSGTYQSKFGVEVHYHFDKLESSRSPASFTSNSKMHAPTFNPIQSEIDRIIDHLDNHKGYDSNCRTIFIDDAF